jgi:hypothetical protein
MSILSKYGHCHDLALSKILGNKESPLKTNDYFCTACAKGKLVAKRTSKKYPTTWMKRV